jgi:xanthine dehydrogenase YagR molybdenum-binding subunit
MRHRGEYYVPIEHHNPMELYAATVIFEPDGKLTVYDKTQGVQNVQRYLCSVLEMEPGEVRVLSRLSAAPSVPGCARNIKGSWRRWRRAR